MRPVLLDITGLVVYRVQEGSDWEDENAEIRFCRDKEIGSVILLSARLKWPIVPSSSPSKLNGNITNKSSRTAIKQQILFKEGSATWDGYLAYIGEDCSADFQRAMTPPPLLFISPNIGSLHMELADFPL